MGNFHKLATLSTAPWAAKQKMNTHLLYCGHWGMGMNPLSHITNFSKKNNHIFQAVSPELNPALDHSPFFFFLHVISTPVRTGETSSSCVREDLEGLMGRNQLRWCWISNNFFFVLLEDAQLNIWITKDIDGDFLFGWRKKKPSSSRNEAGNNPVAHKGVLFSFFNKV